MSHVILVVDDDPGVRASTQRLLAVHGYTVFGAATGAEAIAKASTIRPDVILMDLHMPGINGVHAAQQLKAGRLKGIPIVAYSAAPPRMDMSALFFAVLSKPSSSDHIVQTIESALACRQITSGKDRDRVCRP